MGLQEHIDDLDRMVDGNAAKHEIRSQIAFIGREVEALEQRYSQLEAAQQELLESKTRDDKTLEESFNIEATKRRESRQRHELRYDV